MKDFEFYNLRMKDNLGKISRTANGIIDVSASVTKKDFMLVKSGKAAEDIAYENVENALKFAYDNRERRFASANEIGEFIKQIALLVNCGIVEEKYLFRSGADSDKFPYARIADINYVYDWFCEQIFNAFNNPETDYERLAAFCEYIINCVGHFFTDGCSKISMVMSAYVLMRADSDLPHYVTRDDYYNHIVFERQIPSRENGIMKEADFSVFADYYKTLLG